MLPVTQTDCHCASCRTGDAQYADPQVSRSVRRHPEPEFCPSCYSRILEGHASGIALDLHRVLSEIESTGQELSTHSRAMLSTIEAWLELSCDSEQDTGNIVIGRF